MNRSKYFLQLLFAEVIFFTMTGQHYPICYSSPLFIARCQFYEIFCWKMCWMGRLMLQKLYSRKLSDNSLETLTLRKLFHESFYYQLSFIILFLYKTCFAWSIVFHLKSFNDSRFWGANWHSTLDTQYYWLGNVVAVIKICFKSRTFFLTFMDHPIIIC